jgi:hypothetical protein
MPSEPPKVFISYNRADRDLGLIHPASLRITRSQNPKQVLGAHRGRDGPNLPFARSSRNPSHRKGTRTYQLADAHGRLDHGDLGFHSDRRTRRTK